MEPPTVGRLLSEGEIRLKACGVQGARLDAEVLMARALGIERGALAARLGVENPISEESARTFRRYVKRRALGEPVAYIIGEREFWSLAFEVTPAVLIPRPETEILVEEAITVSRRLDRRSGEPLRAVDVGTGSGAIAVALASELPEARIAAIDSSPEAIAVARRNADRHGVAGRIDLIEGDLLSPLMSGGAGPEWHLVVSNPPYIAEEERESLMREVRDHEPERALFAGPGGMASIERIVPQAARLLVPGGWLLLEISPERAGPVEGLLEAGGWEAIGTRRDYAGLVRMVRARRPKRR